MKHSNYVIFALSKEDILSKTFPMLDELTNLQPELKAIWVRYSSRHELIDSIVNVKDQNDNHVITLGDDCEMVIVFHEHNRNKLFIFKEKICYDGSTPVGVVSIDVTQNYVINLEDYDEIESVTLGAGFVGFDILDDESFIPIWAHWRATYNPKPSDINRPS